MDTRDLLTDTLHHLTWVITSFGGINAINYITGNTVYSYRQSDFRPMSRIAFNSLALDGDRLYIGSSNGLYILHISSFQLSKAILARPAPQDTLSIDNIFKDREGHLWLFCREAGLFILKDSTLTIQGLLPGNCINSISQATLYYDCTQLQNGTILAATSAGLKAFSFKEGKPTLQNDPYPTNPFSNGREIYSCRQDKQGNIWFSTAGYLVRMAPSGDSCMLVKEHISHVTNNSWLDAVYAIFFDKDGNVWLGCQAGLAYSQNTPSCFTGITGSPVSETSIQHTYYLNPVNDSTLYCCAQEGLYKVNPVTGLVNPLLRGQPYYQAFIDPNERLIVSGVEGTFILRHGHKIPLDVFYP